MTSDDNGGNAVDSGGGGGGDSGGWQQLLTVAANRFVGGGRQLQLSSGCQLAKDAGGHDERKMKNMRKFGFSEYIHIGHENR